MFALQVISLTYLHQYMVSLSISGIIMFSVSVAALVLSQSHIDTWLGSEWRHLDHDQKSYLQDQLNCCGFSKNVSVAEDKAWGHPPCNTTTLTRPGVSMLVRVWDNTDIYLFQP